MPLLSEGIILLLFAGDKTLRGIPSHYSFVSVPLQSFWHSELGARAGGAPLGTEEGWFLSSLSTSLPNALSPAPLTEFLINDEMWYK